MDSVNTIKANAKEYRIEDADAEDRIAALENEVAELKDSLTELVPDNGLCYRGQLNASIDLNELYTTGIYYYNTATAPQNVAVSNASIVIVFDTVNSSHTVTLQFTIVFNRDTQAFYYRTYHKADDVWRPWMRITSSETSTTSANSEMA